MKKFFTPASSAGFALLIAYGLAFAGPSEHLNWGSQITQSQCPKGSLVVNVTQKVVNDEDSGTCGNWWAIDDFVRQIQVVQTGANTFCATVSYQGNFNTFAGDSPGACETGTSNGNVLSAGVVGTFQGGYIAKSFTGTLSPTVKTKGSIGSVDYGCDQDGNCPGYVDWTTLYFSSIGAFNLDWWGWVYHAGNNGSWVNSSGGNSGDITGE